MTVPQPGLYVPETGTINVDINERASSRCAPLQALRVSGNAEAGSALVVIDGGGSEYLSFSLVGVYKEEIVLGGELGWHRIRLYSPGRESFEETRVWVDVETDIAIEDGPLRRLWASLHSCVARSQRSVLIDGKVVPFFIRWVRDDTHVQKASVYWAKETGALMECFIERQAESGMIYDYACRLDKAPVRPEVFGPEFSMLDEANKIRWERLPSESDVEYLLVENVFRSWQASGDDARMAALLPRLEKALRYCMTDPIRWDEERELVKRPYTIDTWDFKFFGFDRAHLGDEKSLQDAVFNVHPDTPMCVMHGDNSGMYQACRQVSLMYQAIGRDDKGDEWEEVARHFKERTNELCWNDEYYDHWVPVTPLTLDQGGVDGSKSFTLSNAYNLNRGIADHQQCVSIIRKYQAMREELSETHVAEWLASHPCWPKGFSGIPPGRYVNGGILTIVAGELARGAFSHGFEAYGVDILERLAGLLTDNYEEPDRDPELFVQPYLYCGYAPDGERMNGIPDAWGQAAVVAAFANGLAGVEDRDRRFQSVKLTPRWAAANFDEAKVTIRYPASDGYVAYEYKFDREQATMSLRVTGNATDWRIELLLPSGFEATEVRSRDGRGLDFSTHEVEGSCYAVVELEGLIVEQLDLKLKQKGI